MVRRPALGILLTSLLLYQASARHHTGPDHHTGADPLRPFVERVVVDKIVILTQASCPYLDFAENWILHVEHLGVRNYLVLVDDDVAFQYLDKKFPGHVVHPSATSKVSRHGPKPLMHYDSPDFNNLMCERLGIQQRVLDMGYSFLWTDMDTAWFEDVTKIIPRGLDFVGTGDRFRFDNSLEEENKICGCMTFWSPTAAAKQALQDWKQNCFDSGVDDQRTLQEMWASGELKSKVSWYIMPWQLFPSGALVDQVSQSIDFSRKDAKVEPLPFLPAVIHANYRVGSKAKRKFFQDRSAWMITPEHKYPECDRLEPA